MGEIYEYAVEMSSGAMIYIPSFIKIGSGIKKLIGGIHRHPSTKAQRQHGDRINLLISFENKERILNNLNKILIVTTYNLCWS
jgi:hypothetical protein